MTSSQNWTYKLLQGWLWPLLSSRISTWHSRSAGEQCFCAIPDVLSLERIDPSSDVSSCLAVGVCSVRKKLRKVKQRCHVVSESQSHVVLLFGRDVSSGSLFGYEHNLPTVSLPWMWTGTLRSMASSVREVSVCWGLSDETQHVWEQRSSGAGSTASWSILCWSVGSSSWITDTLPSNCLRRWRVESQWGSPILNFSLREPFTKFFCRLLSHKKKVKAP